MLDDFLCEQQVDEIIPEEYEVDNMKEVRGFPKVGDMIHIYHMFGEPGYSGREGTVRRIDDIGQIHGTWGGCALNSDDDFVILKEEN